MESRQTISIETTRRRQVSRSHSFPRTDADVSLSGFLPVQHSDGVGVSHAEGNEFDVGLCEILLFEAIHGPLAVFLLRHEAQLVLTLVQHSPGAK